MIHHNNMTSVFFFFMFLVLVIAVDEDGNELLSNDVGIPVRKWRNRARRQLEVNELRRKLEAVGGSPDLDLLADFYSDPTKFEENSADEMRSRVLQAEKQYDVVIIGSGWAGLSAAMTLKSKGFNNFVILEAKDHIGGRSYTTVENFDGQMIPLDYGSMWIHGGAANPINDIAKLANINTETSTFNEKIYKGNNQGPIPSSQVDTIYNNRFDRGFMPYQAKQQDSTNVDEPLQTSADKYLNTFANGLEKDVLKYMMNSYIELDYTGTMDELSLWWWDMDAYLDGEDQDDFLLPNGYGPLVEAYAAPVRDKVQTKKVVTRINYQQSMVQVFCGSEMFVAQKVIITVPLGVLKSGSITFEPILPSNQRRSINRIGMGSVNKVFMFWSKDDVFWDLNTEVYGDVVERDYDFNFFNFRAYNGDRPFLIGWVAGAEAERLESLYASSDPSRYSDEMRDLAMVPLRNIFGNGIPLPKKVVATAWNEDPFSRGSYSFNKVYMGKTDRKVLAQPINEKLYIAGEATSHNHFQTVHGAYWSGRDAANLVINSITKLPTASPTEHPKIPTSKPTRSPTRKPSVKPSNFPTRSSKPTSSPSKLISTSNPTMTPTVANKCFSLEIELKTDNWPDETSMSLLERVGSNFSKLLWTASNFDKSSVHKYSLCLQKDTCYQFVITDIWGDGLEPGYYRLTWNGAVIKYSAFRNKRREKTTFGSC